MAGDLVNDENRQVMQTFVHDLESAFHVLLYLITRFVKTSWSEKQRGDYINNILGTESGASSKLLFMESPTRLDDFSISSNAPLEELIVELKRALTVRYSVGYKRENPALKSSLFGMEDYNKSVLKHDNIFELFTMALSSSDWPQDDKAIEQHIPLSKGHFSSEYLRPKRSRADGDGTSGKWHKLPSNSDSP